MQLDVEFQDFKTDKLINAEKSRNKILDYDLTKKNIQVVAVTWTWCNFPFEFKVHFCEWKILHTKFIYDIHSNEIETRKRQKTSFIWVWVIKQLFFSTVFHHWMNKPIWTCKWHQENHYFSMMNFIFSKQSRDSCTVFNVTVAQDSNECGRLFITLNRDIFEQIQVIFMLFP